MRVQPLSDILTPLTLNIRSHVEQLRSNSVINLTIGILGAIMTVGVLASKLLTNHNYTTLYEFTVNFLPKISFVIILQLFAFFFLRLYKSNLEDTKYFQNELSNMVAKTTAFQLAYQQRNKVLISELTKDLSQVERNFKLAAGESLMNIEKSKIEKDLDLESYRIFKEFLQFKQAKESK